MLTETLSNTLEINTTLLKKGALVIRAVNHKLRQQMLSIIHDEGRIAVTRLYVKLRIEQSVCSQHLAILRKAGIVNTERDGKFIFYSVNYQKLKEVHRLCQELNEK